MISIVNAVEMDGSNSQYYDPIPHKQSLPPLRPQDIQTDRPTYSLKTSSTEKYKTVPITEPNIERQVTLPQSVQSKLSDRSRSQRRFDKFFSPIIKGKKIHRITFRDVIEKENGLIDVFDCRPIIVQPKDSCCNVQ